MTEPRTHPKDKLVSDIKLVMSDVDELLRASAAKANGQLDELQTRTRDRLLAARQALSEFEHQALDKLKASARASDQYVHEHPWTSIGVAAGVGALVALLMARRH